MKRCEQKIDNYVAYDNLLCAAVDWIRTSSDQLTTCSDIRGDKLSLTAQLQRITELADLMPEGHAKVETCVNAATVLAGDFDGFGRQAVHAGVEELQRMWEQLEKDMIQAKQLLNDALEQWNIHEEHCHELREWIQSMEKSVKQKVAATNVDTIQFLVKSYEVP